MAFCLVCFCCTWVQYKKLIVMLNKISLLFLLLLLTSPASFSQSAELYFIKMPAELLPTLPLNSRKDLVDFYKNERTSVMPAAFGGEMTLKVLKDDYIFLQTSQATDMQIKLLPISDTLKIIAVIYSASAPMKNSVVNFYNTDWKQISGIWKNELTCLNFFDVAGAGEELSNRFKNHCVRFFIQLSFEADSNDLIVFSPIKEDSQGNFPQEFLPFLKKSFRIDWKNGRF